MAEAQEIGTGTGSGEEDVDDSLPSLITEKGKRQRSRRTKAQAATDRAKQLEDLKRMDTTGWNETKLSKHQNSMQKLAERVTNDQTEAAKKQKMQRNPSSSAGVSKRAPPMKEELNRRLIFARAMTDGEFEKTINAHSCKWGMVADYFNLGFTVHKSKLFNSDEDVTFPPLPTEEHFDATRLQQRWDKIASEYRSLVLMEQSIDQQVTKLSTHIGEKRDQETILSEVMAEISEARNKIKFSKDMEVSGMSRRAFLTPPPRMNFATVATVSLGSASDGSSPASVEPSVTSNNTSLLVLHSENSVDSDGLLGP